MTDFPFRLCKGCNEVLPIRQFRMQDGYRRLTCNMCIHQRSQAAKDAERYRQFNALIRWPVPDVERHGTG